MLPRPNPLPPIRWRSPLNPCKVLDPPQIWSVVPVQGCARFAEILQNLSERQILWSLCSVVFRALTLKLPIQTSLSVAPNFPVSLSSAENCHKFPKTSTPQVPLHSWMQGGSRDAPGVQILSFSRSFRQKVWKNNRLAHALWELLPLRKIQGPQLLNIATHLELGYPKSRVPCSVYVPFLKTIDNEQSNFCQNFCYR